MLNGARRCRACTTVVVASWTRFFPGCWHSDRSHPPLLGRHDLFSRKRNFPRVGDKLCYPFPNKNKRWCTPHEIGNRSDRGCGHFIPGREFVFHPPLPPHLPNQGAGCEGIPLPCHWTTQSTMILSVRAPCRMCVWAQLLVFVDRSVLYRCRVMYDAKHGQTVRTAVGGSSNSTVHSTRAEFASTR